MNNKPKIQHVACSSGKPCYMCADKQGNIGMGDTMENSCLAYVSAKERKQIEREYVKSCLYLVYCSNAGSEPFTLWVEDYLKTRTPPSSKEMGVIWERMKQTLS